MNKSAIMYTSAQSRYKYLSFKNNSVSYRRFAQNDKNYKQQSTETILKETPAHGTYGALLFRPEWKAKRAEILKRDKCCIICNRTAALQVHHRQYHFIILENRFKLPWEYPENLLITLCETCHTRGHSKYKVPTISI